MTGWTTSWSSSWFTPAPAEKLAPVRRGFCLIAVLYFLSAWSDVPTWYSAGAPASTSQLTEFFREAELTSDARWMISPLFWMDSVFAGSSLAQSTWLYRAYLAIGILLAVLTAGGDRLAAKFPSQSLPCRIVSGSTLSVALWIWFVGWANRTVLLAGTFEPVFSVSLAAIAIAPLVSAHPTWRASVAQRLLQVQSTLILLATLALMLAGNTWWNGTGAYAMIAPAEDRWLDVRGTPFESAIIYEGTTLALLALIPFGLWALWRPGCVRWGQAAIILWCALVAALSQNILFAMTIGTAVIAFEENRHTPDGTDGANTLNVEGVTNSK